MASPTDVRKGKVLNYQGAPHLVLDVQHRTQGRQAGFMQVTMRNLPRINVRCSKITCVVSQSLLCHRPLFFVAPWYLRHLSRIIVECCYFKIVGMAYCVGCKIIGDRCIDASVQVHQVVSFLYVSQTKLSRGLSAYHPPALVLLVSPRGVPTF